MGEYAAPVSIIGKGLSALSSINAGNAASAAGDANANMFVQMANMARQRAAINAQRTRTEGAQIGSRIIQSFGAAGVDATSGSSLDQVGKNAAEYEFRALTESWQGEVEANQSLFKASVARYQGQSAANSAYSKAIGSLIGAVSDVGNLDFGGGGGGVSDLNLGAVAKGGVDDSGWGATDWGAEAAKLPRIN